MPRFVVDLGDVNLTDEEHAAISGAIHGAVIGQLAKVSDASAHHGTKTLNRAGMGFSPPDPATLAARPAKAPKPGKPAKKLSGK